MLQEQLVLLGSGRRFLLTLDCGAEHDPPTLVEAGAYAHVLETDGTTRDCLAMVTQPVDKKGTAQQLPRDAWPLGEDRVLLGYQRHREPRWYREVCMATGKELDRFDADALGKVLKTVAKASARALDRELADFDLMVADGGKARVLAASAHGLLVDSGVRRLFVRRSDGRFMPGASAAGFQGGHRAVAVVGDAFVTEVQPTRKAPVLVRLGATADDGATRWERGKVLHATSLASAAATPDWVALGSFRGEVSVLDLRGTTIEKLPPFTGFGKDDEPTVRMSPDARYVAAYRGYEAGPVAIFDRDTGRSALLPRRAIEILPPTKQYRPGDWRLGAVALLEEGVALLEGGVLAVTPWSALTWIDTAAPAKKPARKATPLDTLEAALATVELRGHAEHIRAWHAPGVALRPTRKRADLAVGEAKFNGQPDLAHGTEWPRWRGVPMAFLAQLDLAQAHAAAPDLPLPAAGLLSFFLGLDPDFPTPSFIGDVNADRAGARVLYTPPGTALTRLAFPKDVPAGYFENGFHVCALKVERAGPVLPELANPLVKQLALTPAQSVQYEALADLLNGDRESDAHWGSRLGGQPAILQNDNLAQSAELLERGAYEAPSGMALMRDPAFLAASARWRQLLQLAEGKEGWGWGDSGLVQWMARGDQFADARFDPVWAIGVCH